MVEGARRPRTRTMKVRKMVYVGTEGWRDTLKCTDCLAGEMYYINEREAFCSDCGLGLKNETDTDFIYKPRLIISR